MYEGLANCYDALMADVDYDSWAAYLGSFLAPGSAVAECACGTGALTLRLCRAGHAVTGLDISPEMLAVAAEKARKAGLRIPFVRMDMRRLALHKPVDAVICACDGVNYLSREGAAEFFGAAYNALRAGGKLLFDISSRYKLENVLGNNTFAEDDGECAYIWKNCYDPQSRLLEMRLSFFTRAGEGYARSVETQVQRAHSQREILSALQRAGFAAEAYAAFTREPPAADEERIQFAAVKP